MEQVIHMRKSRFGSRRIAHELREKGIAENLIAAVLPNLQETQQATAREVWRELFFKLSAGSAPAGQDETRATVFQAWPLGWVPCLALFAWQFKRKIMRYGNRSARSGT